MPHSLDVGDEREIASMQPLVETDDAQQEASADETLENFLHSVSVSSECTLLMDFDGTLAPFRIDPAMVRPWAGVEKLLNEIQDQGRTRIAIISGRPARDVALQIQFRRPVEIWGLHGAERLLPGGQLELEQLPAEQTEALSGARTAIHDAKLGLRTEDKSNAVVVHWRGKSRHAAETARRKALQILKPFVDQTHMNLLQFDGGAELRAGRNKGEAVRLLLSNTSPGSPVAYLGDDTTDEDAFVALSRRGLGILVRRSWRSGAAKLWLRPPAELRGFLKAWLAAVS